VGQRDRRHRTADLAGARRRDRQAHRRGRAGLLRCHRPDRSLRHDRHVARLAAVALRQGGTWWIGRRLHQLSAHARAIPRLLRALLAGEKVTFPDWETPYFDGCLPIEVMAERGPDTLRHGPMKPFGLTNPHAPEVKPYAVVQLRQDNRLGTLFNMVGFQTKLKHGEQTRIFRTIPGLERAEFARLGGLHRNTFLNAPKLLDSVLRLNAAPRLRFAGQITGCEGYVESAAIGLIAGRFAAAERLGRYLTPPPPTTA